ncbi:MAG: hypothetical protein ABIJ40_12300 [Bacteroidota bacterium]
MSYKRWKKFIKIKDYDPKEVNFLVNNTQTDKEVMWNSKVHTIKAGEELPMNNFLIGHFMKHTLGLSVKPTSKTDTRYAEFEEAELSEPVLAPIKGETQQASGDETSKKMAELEAKLEMVTKLLEVKAKGEVVSEVEKPKVEEPKVEPKENKKVTCGAKTAAGKPCNNSVVKGTKFCAPHSK